MHEPASHPGYLAFVQDVAERWATERVVFIGDVVDHHAVSFHQTSPVAAGSEDEANATQAGIDRWRGAWPRAVVTIGNHDERVHRLAASVKVPPRFVRDYSRTWNTPGWRWVRDVQIDGVHYHHGTGLGGQAPALTAARQSMRSTVVGHVHSVGGVRWACGPGRRVFGLDTGCGVDEDHPAMSYGRDLVRRPVLGCGVVIDGHPYHEAMDASPRGPYARRRFKGANT